ncbi:hypothetical protein AAP_03683 [Ascosphaera apis ARSEF 7405]|uniref:Uncharacterized protein n=1 Tax=Ascosphaera apis ARSEF 7405 TaxID=392613 RepID=A0A167XXA1_9EURO|nr:hypothetical protein AAP_03683 [Ascosphaera apis ARSEF 7405]
MIYLNSTLIARASLAQSILRLHNPLQSLSLLRHSSSSTTSPPSTPESASQNHHDLPSFLAHAARTSLSPTSTVYTGTHYEYTVLTSLRNYGFDLTRIGGSNDFGVDLVGTWSVIPSTSTYRPQPIRTIVQCKALKKKAGPNLIRELEGSFAGAPVGWRGDGVFGVLATTREATKGVREALAKSRYPLVWILAEQDGGKVRQCLWNHRAMENGLEGLGVRVRYGGGEEVDGSVVLTWDGEEMDTKLKEG